MYYSKTSRDCLGQRLKSRDCPTRIGTVDNYESNEYLLLLQYECVILNDDWCELNHINVSHSGSFCKATVISYIVTRWL